MCDRFQCLPYCDCFSQWGTAAAAGHWKRIVNGFFGLCKGISTQSFMASYLFIWFSTSILGSWNSHWKLFMTFLLLLPTICGLGFCLDPMLKKNSARSWVNTHSILYYYNYLITGVVVAAAVVVVVIVWCRRGHHKMGMESNNPFQCLHSYIFCQPPLHCQLRLFVSIWAWPSQDDGDRHLQWPWHGHWQWLWGCWWGWGKLQVPLLQWSHC